MIICLYVSIKGKISTRDLEIIFNRNKHECKDPNLWIKSEYDCFRLNKQRLGLIMFTYFFKANRVICLNKNAAQTISSYDFPYKIFVVYQFPSV
jgi:hypothetical protein